MNALTRPRDEYAAKHEALSAQIARQRGELAAAYQNLEKPIRYTEYGMRGFGFLRNNPWIFVALPAVFSIASNLLGLVKKKSPKPEPKQTQKVENPPRGMKKNLQTVWGYGWQIYQLYRRVRPYLP